MIDKGHLWFIATSLVLAVALFFPVAKMMWVFSVRRLQVKLDRKLDEDEVRGQLRRARFIAAVVVTAFAFAFNFNVFGIPSFR